MSGRLLLSAAALTGVLVAGVASACPGAAMSSSNATPGGTPAPSVSAPARG